MRELSLYRLEGEGNEVMKEMEEAPQCKKLNRNWDISREEYAARLCE